MILYKHFTKPKKCSKITESINDYTSEDSRKNLESILKEEVLYGSRYHSFFYNKQGLKEHLPYMISITECRLYDLNVFLKKGYSHGIVFAPGFIESKEIGETIYKPCDDLHELNDMIIKYFKQEVIPDFISKQGFRYSVESFRNNNYRSEKEWKIKLSEEKDHWDEKKKLGMRLENDNILCLIVPEDEREYFEKNFNIPTYPQERLIIGKNPLKFARKAVSNFSDMALLKYNNRFWRKRGRKYEWIERNNKIYRQDS